MQNIDIKKQLQQQLELVNNLETQINVPGAYSDVSLQQEYSAASSLLKVLQEIDSTQTEIASTESLLSDPDFVDTAKQELDVLNTKLATYISSYSALTATKLEGDESPAIIEFRAGTGGVEASLFAQELMNAYMKYFTSEGLNPEIYDVSENAEGGIKEAVISLAKPGSFGLLRFESGVHRVQRVPSTESAGRIHTSAISIVVMPKVNQTQVVIKDSDIKIDVYRSSGPGGQSVNTTDSAVRITHLPSGIVVTCQDNKSQHKNKDRAMDILRSKLFTQQQQMLQESTNELRSAAIKSGDRSAKIRTYNFPQGRITDHRTKQTWYSISEFMSGNVKEVVTLVNTAIREAGGQIDSDEDDND